MNTFPELPLCTQLQCNLTKHGFIRPTPVQREAIPPALMGRDIVATAQTGTGKTLAFLLPLIHSLAKPQAKPAPGIQALILTPTRELALQIQEAATNLTQGLGLTSTVVVGGMSETVQLRNIRRGAQIVIATPGRLCDFLDRKLAPLAAVRMLVLDEADRMLDMGFLPALKVILRSIPQDRQTLLFSATLEKSVAHLIAGHVRDAARVSIGVTTSPIDQVDLHVYEVEQDRKLSLLRKLLCEEAGTFLVFARTKHGTDRLAKRLSASGIEAARIHGNRTQGQRNQALSGFKNGNYRVLVATDVAARGIHVDGIAHVVNYDLPQVAEDFIHRVGRTGRAGARGTASTFATRAERGEIRNIEAAMKTRLTRRDVLIADLPREEKQTPHSASAEKVIPIRPAKSSRPQRAGSLTARGRRSGRG